MLGQIVIVGQSRARFLMNEMAPRLCNMRIDVPTCLLEPFMVQD